MPNPPDPDFEKRVRARHASEMNEMRSLGICEVRFLTVPLERRSLLFLFPITYPLLEHREFGTYALPMGMGIRLKTEGG